MKDTEFNKLVDEYYNARESQDNLELPDNSDASFLFSSLEKMDVIENKAIELDIDIMSVILQGEEIVETKKARREFTLFIVCGISLILALASAVVFINKNIFIYVELAIAVVLPFALIPISYIKAVRGNY
ncbi:MAG: hypothetical protein Q8930_16765 [Bacillota bacterium]|nr:hypothetical protein [Bacillota bacterium]